MGGMANRAREAGVDVVAVLVPTCIGDDVVKVMALAAHRVRTPEAQIRVWKQVCNQLTGRGRLAEFVVPLQDVGVRRSVRTAGASPSKLPVIVAIVAVGAEDLAAHGAAIRG